MEDEGFGFTLWDPNEPDRIGHSLLWLPLDA